MQYRGFYPQNGPKALMHVRVGGKFGNDERTQINEERTKDCIITGRFLLHRNIET